MRKATRRSRIAARDGELQNRLAFQKAIGEYPSNVCMSCKKLCYSSSINAEKVPAVYANLRRWGVSTLSDGWVCNRCKNKIVTAKLPTFCISNNMQAGIIPAELSSLNPLEICLVSRLHCFMKLYILKFGQRAVSGGCINFPVNMAEVCAKLPRTANDDGVILVYTGGLPGKPGGRWYSVSREHVLNAVHWLINNNVLYVDVNVDNSYTSSVVGDSSYAATDQPEVEMGVVRMDYTLPNIEVNDILVGKQNSHVIHLGRVVAEPINLFIHPNAEEMAFPNLFPLGINGFRAAREVRITALDYFQTRLLSADSRWRMNVPYIFWACNMVERLRLQDQISIALHMRSSVQHGRRTLNCLRAVLHSFS